MGSRTTVLVVLLSTLTFTKEANPADYNQSAHIISVKGLGFQVGDRVYTSQGSAKSLVRGQDYPVR